MATKIKVCNDCGFEGEAGLFVTGRRLCKVCQRGRMQRSRKKNVPELDFEAAGTKTSGKNGAGSGKRAGAGKGKKTASGGARIGGSGGASQAFSTRDGLADTLKDNLARALDDANQQVEFNKVRLALAMESRNPDLVNDANNGLRAAMQQHIQLTTRLMEKLQALEDLRAQQEKSKPVTFLFIQAPVDVKILPTRSLPDDLQGTQEEALA